MNGHEAVFNVPPSGFKPIGASVTTLRKYNLPTPKMLGRQRWMRLMKNFRMAVPPPFLVRLNHVHFRNTANWAGNYATSHTYSFVHSSWVEPTLHTSCSDSDESEWVGLGGVNGNNLAQDGTASGAGLANHQAFWEILPAGPPLNLYATAGKCFDAYTSRETQNGHAGFTFFLENDYTGLGLSPFIQSSSYDGSTADVIMERIHNLKDLGSFNITENDVAYGGSDHLFTSSLPHVGVFMYSGTDELATPGSISNGTGGWSMNYIECN